MIVEIRIFDEYVFYVYMISHNFNFSIYIFKSEKKDLPVENLIIVRPLL